MIRVPTTQFVHYRRKPEHRRWTFRCLVIATRPIHLVDMIERELTRYPEAIEGKVSNYCWRQSGLYVATLFFHTATDAMAFRERNYNDEYCVVAGPIRKSANRSNNDQTEVHGARPENDAVPEANEGQAAHFRQLVAPEPDMALYLDGLAFA